MNGTGKKAFEYIVVGCGGIGSAAVYWLSREASSEVLGLEQFHLGHDRGGSEDHSRIIRLSYHDQAYTTLTPHTYEAWSEIEDESGLQLVFETGGLDLESMEDASGYINHYAAAMAAAGIPYEELSAHEVMDRFPQFTLDESVLGVYQPGAGFVDAGKANAVHIALARARGATVLDEAPVYGVRTAGDGVEVETAAGTFCARKLVVAAGAWTNRVLGHLGYGIPITCTQEQVTYFQTPHLR
jgi:sarcosine oxidase